MSEHHISKLYYEAHVTIEPVFDERLEQLRNIASGHGFRVADLLMKKRLEDTEERSAKDTFMTGHSVDLNDIRKRLTELIQVAKLEGYKIWRYKIEDTIVDSRFNDDYKLLENQR